MPGHLIADTMAIMAQPRSDHGRRRQVTVSLARVTLGPPEPLTLAGKAHRCPAIAVVAGRCVV